MEERILIVLLLGRKKKKRKETGEGKASSWNAGDQGLIPGWEDPLEKENGNPLQYSCPSAAKAVPWQGVGHLGDALLDLGARNSPFPVKPGSSRRAGWASCGLPSGTERA